jgi:hypothetical protein
LPKEGEVGTAVAVDMPAAVVVDGLLEAAVDALSAEDIGAATAGVMPVADTATAAIAVAMDTVMAGDGAMVGTA